jgi:ABC-type amino acid transport substrate-binding protein
MRLRRVGFALVEVAIRRRHGRARAAAFLRTRTGSILLVTITMETAPQADAATVWELKQLVIYWCLPEFMILSPFNLLLFAQRAIAHGLKSRGRPDGGAVGAAIGKRLLQSKNVLHLVALCGLLASPSIAQEIPRAEIPVMVGLYVSPPFVVQEHDRFTGMAVELWESLAATQGLRSEYRSFPTVRALIDAAASGDIDVAVTNLTITQDRALRIDFTHPWFDAGLRIMVNDHQGTRFSDIVGGLKESGYLRAYAWLALFIAAATLLLTVFDRRFYPDFPRRWRDGTAESFFSIMSVVAGRPSGRQNIFGWIGRLWQGLWLVFGIAVLAYVTSSVTSVMTTLSLTNQINSLADLPGRAVGVFTGSVSEAFARSSGFDLHSFANIDEAAAALRDGSIAAIVGDAPVLEYYSHTHPEHGVRVVGGIFEPDKYGFGLAHNSSLTRPLTVELLGAHERGTVEELHVKYFGESP